MTSWKIVMLLALLLAVAPVRGRPARLRVGLAMLAASVASWLYYAMWFYMAIDIVAAIVIMWPPRNVWQKAIGLCFIAMLLLTTGYVFATLQIFSSAVASPDLLQFVHVGLGWLALGIYVLWTLDDALGLSLDRNRRGNSAPSLYVGRDR